VSLTAFETTVKLGFAGVSYEFADAFASPAVEYLGAMVAVLSLEVDSHPTASADARPDSSTAGAGV
jgi:hypothetical protein